MTQEWKRPSSNFNTGQMYIDPLNNEGLRADNVVQLPHSHLNVHPLRAVERNIGQEQEH